MVLLFKLLKPAYLVWLTYVLLLIQRQHHHQGVVISALLCSSLYQSVFLELAKRSGRQCGRLLPATGRDA
ncbi:unnamed protein product [Arabidopsis halleri]